MPGHSVDVQGLHRRFGARWALAGVDLQVPAGGSLCVTGPNGSGKSTLLRVLATALRADAGTVRVASRDLWAERLALRPTLCFVGHVAGTWEELGPRENLVAWARLAGVEVEPDALLERVGLDPGRRDAVRTLSAGQRRRLGLARLLLRRPQLALLDEPTTALDDAGRVLLRQILGELRADGCTLVVATHEPDELAGICEAALRLREGRVGPA